jgi:hypothetical protein
VRRPTPAPTVRAVPTKSNRRARLGIVLIALGIAGILWGVFHVLDAIPSSEQKDFAHRTTYGEAKAAVHETFLGGLLRALAGLALAMAGARVRARALREPERT